MNRPGSSYAKLTNRSEKYRANAVTEATQLNRKRSEAAYVRWATSMGVSPTEPSTLVCYLHAHVEDWSDSYMSTLCSHLKAAYDQASLSDPSVGNPARSDTVGRYLNAVTRAKRFRTKKVSDPLCEWDLPALASVVGIRQRGSGEVLQRRGEAALLLSTVFEVRTRQLARVRRSDISLGPFGEFNIVLPWVPRGGGPVIQPMTVTVSPTGHTEKLHSALSRLLELLDGNDGNAEGIGDAVFNIREQRGGKLLRGDESPFAAAQIRAQWLSAYRRAGFEGDLSDPPGLDPQSPDTEWLCHNMSPNLRKDVRDLTMAVLGVIAVRRNAEVNKMTVEDLYTDPNHTYWWEVPEQKNRSDRVWVSFEHLEGHGLHCPACLLSAWLRMSGIGHGLVFRTMRSGGRLKDGEVYSYAATLGTAALSRRAGLEGRHTSSSWRKGGTTSRAYDDQTPTEITAVSGHLSENVMFRHYVFLSRLLAAVATRQKAVAVHQLGRLNRDEPQEPIAPRPGC